MPAGQEACGRDDGCFDAAEIASGDRRAAVVSGGGKPSQGLTVAEYSQGHSADRQRRQGIDDQRQTTNPCSRAAWRHWGVGRPAAEMLTKPASWSARSRSIRSSSICWGSTA